MNHSDLLAHATGQSRFLDDIPEQKGTLHAVVFGSPVAHGRITGVDLAEARQLPGVVGILSAADIPGENQIGGIVQDEPLLAEGEVHFVGQPIAVVVADTPRNARRASDRPRPRSSFTSATSMARLIPFLPRRRMDSRIDRGSGT